MLRVTGTLAEVSSLRPVVLSGGSGTRLWPLSTSDRPKQFVPLFDGRSLFDLTLARLDGLDDVGPPIVVTGRAHVDLAEQALDRAGHRERLVLVEPAGRNTAPAAIASALAAAPGEVLLIVPSDHLISDTDGFQRAVAAATAHATMGGIVTFGIQPSRPETGYGYIEVGESGGDGIFEVIRFEEKPDRERAEQMVADGCHVWNSGMFVARVDHLLAEAERYCPEVLEGVRRSLPGGPGPVEELSDEFESVKAVSIDHAIMEKTDDALVIPIDVGWDDVGSYRSLLAALGTDDRGNHIEGDVITDEVSGSFITATSRRVAVAGMVDVVVVETPETVLVVPLDRSQAVGELAARLESD